jgi:hypothetical protein
MTLQCTMSDHLSPEPADDEFFDALTTGHVSRLEPLLDERRSSSHDESPGD